MIRSLKGYKAQLKRDLRQAIKDCEDDLKEQKRLGNYPVCIDLEGKIYAYEFVLNDMVDTVEFH